jgi:hypothetical protein
LLAERRRSGRHILRLARGKKEKWVAHPQAATEFSLPRFLYIGEEDATVRDRDECC